MKADSGLLAEILGDKLRSAMRGHASSVSVISAADSGGTRYAMSATSAMSLTLDPPAMLVCINRKVSCYPLLSTGTDFCINILAVDHLPIARLCVVAKGEGRFSSGDWRNDSNGVPYLSDAQAAIFCAQDKRIPYGTHDIFISRVRDVVIRRAIDPLVYVDGYYKALRAGSLTNLDDRSGGEPRSR